MTAPKKKGGPRKTAAASKTGSAGTDDAALTKVLERALERAGEEGFTGKLLAQSGKDAGVDGETLTRLFPDGAPGLVAEFSRAADAEMEKRLAGLDLPARKMRERIALAVRTRIDVLRPHKQAARRAAALLTLPAHAALGMKLLYGSVDAMWRAAGDTSTDFNFYTKRAILAGVYSATLVQWFNDKSADEKPTSEFLDARIENVMQFEKFKAGVKKSLAGMPSFAEILRGTAKK